MRFTLPLIALAAAAAPVAAATPADTTTVPVRVSYADIDVSTAEGRKALEERIESKLREACTIVDSSRFAYGRPVLDDKCFNDARAEAMQAVAQVAANAARGGRQASAN
ncbi:UrcA family protein [Erythrobacter sp. YT30]|uniref:UrcA family protein n=1 Tax=Erythrobacter sp. YT30 TaxID=1735012 RepID=UPI0018D229B7|nr:UrcA family protein [Erythrobacter sp. YT30]